MSVGRSVGERGDKALHTNKLDQAVLEEACISKAGLDGHSLELYSL